MLNVGAGATGRVAEVRGWLREKMAACVVPVDGSLSACFSGRRCESSCSVPNLGVLAGCGVHRKTSRPGDRKFRVLSAEQLLVKSRKGVTGESKRLGVSPQAMWGQKAEPKPTSIPLEPIVSEAQLDQILRDAQEQKQSVIIEWTAAWCRKCIFLKPKLEKLAADYHNEIKFYYVDLNTVPKALVVERGQVSKFPTIQLWKDGGKFDQIIGGKEPWQIMDEIRDMIGKSKPRV